MKIYRYLFLLLSISSLSAMNDEPFDDDWLDLPGWPYFEEIEAAPSAPVSLFSLTEPVINEDAVLIRLPTSIMAEALSEPTVQGAEDDALSSRPDRRKKGRFPCTVFGCLYPAASERERLSHEHMHAIEHLTCEERGCGYITIRPCWMEKHKRTHTGEKPYMCSEPGCGKRFAQRSALKSHRHIHTGERPYVCSNSGCGQSFADRSTLKNHERIHSDARPHVCPICNSCFVRKSHLATHLCTEKHKKAVAAAAACALVLPPQQPVVQEPLKPVSGEDFWLEILRENI